MTKTIIITPSGNARHIYNDKLQELGDALGSSTTKRASHVEPAGNKWTADLSPVDGPVLGPYDTRAEALYWEVDYLETRNIPEVTA